MLRLINLLSIFIVIVSQVGCSTYKPKQLPNKPNFPDNIQNIGKEYIVYDPSFKEISLKRDLLLKDLEVIALLNNPDLKTTREALKVSKAEAFAAGLFPDPQIGWSRDYSAFYQPGISPSYNIGINYDLNSIIGYSSNQKIANSELDIVNLSLLWQEWQVLCNLRLLITQRFYLIKQSELLNESYKLTLDLYEKKNIELFNHNITSSELSSIATTLQGIISNKNSLEIQIKQIDSEINNLLGLPVNTKIPDINIYLPEEKDFKLLYDKAVENLPLRLDLQALASGYKAADERLRQAILLQFPAINLGVNKARDTSSVFTRGFSLNISLPIFNRNQGNIKIAEATRDQLHQEYQARLNSATNEIKQIIAELELLKEQLAVVNNNIIELQESSQNFESTYKQGNLDISSYISLKANMIDQAIEKLKLEQWLAEHLVILYTLITFNSK